MKHVVPWAVSKMDEVFLDPGNACFGILEPDHDARAIEVVDIVHGHWGPGRLHMFIGLANQETLVSTADLTANLARVRVSLCVTTLHQVRACLPAVHLRHTYSQRVNVPRQHHTSPSRSFLLTPRMSGR